MTELHQSTGPWRKDDVNTISRYVLESPTMDSEDLGVRTAKFFMDTDDLTGSYDKCALSYSGEFLPEPRYTKLIAKVDLGNTSYNLTIEFWSHDQLEEIASEMKEDVEEKIQKLEEIRRARIEELQKFYGLELTLGIDVATKLSLTKEDINDPKRLATLIENHVKEQGLKLGKEYGLRHSYLEAGSRMVDYIRYYEGEIKKLKDNLGKYLDDLEANKQECYVQVKVCARSYDGPAEIPSHSPLLQNEINRLKPHITGLLRTLPGLEAPFKHREHYAEAVEKQL